MIVAWATAFLLTQAVEVPVALWLVRGPPRARVAGAALLATAITHPVLWFVAPAFFPTFWSWVIVGELAVAAVEGLVYRRALPELPPLVALGCAIQVNAASYLVGLLVDLFARG